MARLRLIGGAWSSRLLTVPDLPGLRPTPDRVRETLFNWLGQELTGLSCLDLFAGTGALGFEAASRGAARVTLVERDRRLVRRLEENRRLLGGDTVRILLADALECARAWSEPVDVLFLDPPYRERWPERLEPWLDRLVRPEGAIYLEAEHEIETLGAWHTVKRGRAGQVHYHLLERSP